MRLEINGHGPILPRLTFAHVVLWGTQYDVEYEVESQNIALFQSVMRSGIL